jgi:predicted type IV restriction endonuclease
MQIIADSATAEAQNFNEAEIRFHILDPILRALGYPESENVYLILEEKLEYPYLHIGRRSKKDLPLGFSDYRAGVKGARGSFVAEAKAGNVAISMREVEQAHSYAAHAQVGANYFVLCNGQVIEVYETLSGPKATPIVAIRISDVNTRFYELENILAPANLEKNCKVFHDKGLKLAPGLASTARIRSGFYSLKSHEVRFIVNKQDITLQLREVVPQVAEMDRQIELLKSAFELRVSDGHVRRGEDGKIIAHIEFSGATVHSHEAMKIMGINCLSFTTAEKFISIDPSSPTVCESLADFTVTKGTMIPQFFGGAASIEGDMQGGMFIKAAMHFEVGRFRGEYIALSDQCIEVPGLPPLTVEMDFAGTFELVLDG